MEINNEALKAQWDFLKNEYNFLADYLKLNYEERDRYVKFYTAILTAAIAAIGLALKKENLEIAIFILTFFVTLFSLFILKKVTRQRIGITEYKNYLNVIRGKLSKLAKLDNDTELFSLPKEPNQEYLKNHGGDAIFLCLLAWIVGISAASSSWMLSFLLSPHEYYQKNRYLFVLLAIAIGALIVIRGNNMWKNMLKKEDQNKEKKIKELADKEGILSLNKTRGSKAP